MAKGQMKSNKEARKPKKDAKKPAAAPALKAAPVPAAKIKDKKYHQKQATGAERTIYASTGSAESRV